jgi:hypothetical protein
MSASHRQHQHILLGGKTMTTTSRRHFLQSVAATSAFLGLGDLAFLSRLRPVSAAEADLDPKLVRLSADIEPTVRLLEDTPRERLLEEVAFRIHKGLSYREVLAALLLAGVRNVQPRPNVGFKFHAVLVVNSAHLASLASPDKERWLPIFWALDYFKDSQAKTKSESGWRMKPVKEEKLPSARQARSMFLDAMDTWDEEQADVAVAALARSAGSDELFEIFCRYGARDFRSIGHKAIYVANAWRTLHCIGWQHAEPVLRSLAYALLYHDGVIPSQNDLPADRPGKRNRELVAQVRPEWLEGKPSAEATTDLLATLRRASGDESCDKVVQLLNHGVAPGSIWDGLFAGATELLMRQPGIVALHAVTTTNALHYAFGASGSDETRRWLLLQNAAFLPLFREAMAGRGAVKDLQIDKLEPLPIASAGSEALGEIFSDLSKDRMMAARKAYAFLDKTKTPGELIDAARLLVFLKGTDSHDYKFSSAVMEDCYSASPAWRNRYLAASLFQLRGSGSRDNELVARTRAALKG